MKKSTILLLALLILPAITLAQSFPEGTFPNEHNLDGCNGPA